MKIFYYLITCLLFLNLKSFSQSCFSSAVNGCSVIFYPCSSAGYGTWDFGDGTPTTPPSMQSTTHTYSQNGNYYVSHTFNGQTSYNNVSITNCQPPCTLQAAYCPDNSISGSNSSYYNISTGEYILTGINYITIHDISTGGGHSSSWTYRVPHQSLQNNNFYTTYISHTAYGNSFVVALPYTSKQKLINGFWDYTYFEKDELPDNICLTIVSNNNSQCINSTCNTSCQYSLVSENSYMALKTYENTLMPNRQFNVYPNPVENGSSLNIDLPFDDTQLSENALNIKLIDVTGRVLVSKTTSQSTVNLATSGYAKGIYLIKVTNAENISLFSKKVIIE